MHYIDVSTYKSKRSKFILWFAPYITLKEIYEHMHLLNELLKYKMPKKFIKIYCELVGFKYT